MTTQAELEAAIAAARNAEIDAIIKQLQPQEKAPPKDPQTGMPEGYFTDPRSGRVTTREALAAKPSNMLEKLFYPAGQGLSFGYSDEALGLLNKLNLFQGGTADERQRFGEEFARARQEAVRRDAPGASLAAELGGAVVSPAAKVGQAKTLLGQLAKSTGLGAGYAGLYGSGTAEGSVEQRIEEGVDAAPYGAVFGFITPPITNTIGAIGNKTYKALFQKSVTKPTVKTLHQLKEFAYDKVKKSGHTFSAEEIDNLALRVMRVMDEVDYLPEEEHINAAIDLFNRQTIGGGKALTLPQVDKLRQRLYNIYKKGFKGGNQYDHRIYEMIEQVDDMIASHGDASALYKAAREAHGRYKKSQLIEDAYSRAERAAQASGSGGNVLNNYKQAVNRILNSKQAKYFTKDEIAVMEKMIRGDVDQQMLRLAGKISPSGNGLMLMLNGLAVFQNPGFLTLTGIGAMSKKAAEGLQQKDLDDIANYLATGNKPKVQLKSGQYPLAASVVANQSKEINKRENQ